MKSPKPVMADESVALSLFIDAMFHDTASHQPTAQPLVVESTDPDDPTQTIQGEVGSDILFSVVGCVVGCYRLAVPLEDMSGIIARPPKLDRLPGLPAWIPGVVRERGRLVRVVNMHDFFEESADSQSPDAANSRILIIGSSLDGKDWGLACDSVSEVIKVGQRDLSRNKNPNQRPWLAATVLMDMSLLLNPRAMCKEFDRRAGIVA